VMDQLIGETVKGISETITEPSLINIDYADVRAIMSKGGVAVMLVGESKQQNKAESVVRECLSNPMLDIDYRGATGSLIHITGGSDLTLQDAEEIATSLTYELDPHADVIWGARVRNDMEGKVRVLAIMTGVKNGQILGTRQSYKTVVEEIDAKRANPIAPAMPKNRKARDYTSGGSLLEWVG
jgi:cell division protein FtsZ